MKSLITPLSVKLFLAVFFLCNNISLEAKIYFVNISATGIGNGSSWSDAYSDLQDAINVSTKDDTICVAEGTYIPTHVFGADLVRNATFYINKSILLFGGFSGIPGTEGNFTERNPQLNETILTGDTGVSGNDTDNAFHVIYFDHVSDTARLDGFTITKGNGEGGAGLDSYGAGIYNDAIHGFSSPSLANCIIRDNKTSELGGGMVNNAQDDGEAKPLIVNCTFINNQGSSGGGIGNYADNNGVVNPILISCSFLGNSAPTGQGGAIVNITHGSVSTLKLFNCIFTGNHSPTSAAITCFSTGTSILCPEVINCALSGNTGGALRVVDLGDHLSKIIVRNSIFWNNAGNHGLTSNGASTDVTFSIMQFGFEGEANLSSDPLFVSEPPLTDGPHTLGDLHIVSSSPA
ncbi:MAG TPA: hypothetical protein VMZ69_11395, partial [Saprospiraceae bacterium]|nr:hypothetical protein [Saprospiraceae bacterium]